MNLSGIFRRRGDPSAPGPHIIAGVIPAREELPPFDEAVQAMRTFCLPCAGNIVNLEYYRLQRGKTVASPPRGTRVSSDAPHPTQPTDSAERPAFDSPQQSGISQTHTQCSTDTARRSVSQPGFPVTQAPAAPQKQPEGA